MPQTLPIIFSIGQQQTASSTASTSESSSTRTTIYSFSGLSQLGVSQEPPSLGTAQFNGRLWQNAEWNSDHPARPVRSGVAVAPPLKGAGRDPALQTRQLWEGTVVEIHDGRFLATLTDRTNPGNSDEGAAFDYAEVSPEDYGLVVPGAAFYWTIGSERTVGGQVKNISVLQFRRVPAWTKRALTRAAERARHVRKAFHDQE